MRVFLIFVGWVSLLAAGLFCFDALTLSTRPNATVLQQIVGYIGLGTSALVMSVCFGSVHIGDRVDALAAQRAGSGTAG
jgi:hypothetical protein